MRLVQHDYDAELVLAGQFLDVLADAAMKRGKAGVRLQSHPDRDLAVEVAAVDGGVVRVVEAVASWGRSSSRARKRQVLPQPESPVTTAEVRPSIAALSACRASCNCSVWNM